MTMESSRLINKVNNIEVAAAFKYAISYPQDEALYIPTLEKNNFSSEGLYAVTIISSNHDDFDIAVIENHLVIPADISEASSAVFKSGNEMVIISNFSSENELSAFAENIYTQINNIDCGQKIYMGTGMITKSIRSLYKSYNQAKSIIKLNKNSKISLGYLYSDLGMYKLLIGIEDEDIIQDYLTKTLKPLIDYDAKNNSNLVETLHIYLKHNGSVMETSNEMFVHRNTTNYKINKIGEILDVDLSSLEERAQLILAFALQGMTCD